MTDDAGTLIDMETRNMYELACEVEDLLNEQNETIQALIEDKNELQDYMARRDDKVKKTLQEFYDATKQLKTVKGTNQLVLTGYLDLIKDIANELGVDLE